MEQETQLPDINSSKVTECINATAFELLKRHPKGLSWTDMKTKIEESDPGFHPKTANDVCGNSSKATSPRQGL